MVYVRASCCELARLSRESLNWFSIDACFQRLSGITIDSFSSYKNPLISFYWFLSFSKASTRINNSRWKSYWNLGHISWWRLSLPPTRPPVFWFFQTPWPFILIVSGIEACCRLIVCSSTYHPSFILQPTNPVFCALVYRNAWNAYLSCIQWNFHFYFRTMADDG